MQREIELIEADSMDHCSKHQRKYTVMAQYSENSRNAHNKWQHFSSLSRTFYKSKLDLKRLT